VVRARSIFATQNFAFKNVSLDDATWYARRRSVCKYAEEEIAI